MSSNQAASLIDAISTSIKSRGRFVQRLSSCINSILGVQRVAHSQSNSKHTLYHPSSSCCSRQSHVHQTSTSAPILSEHSCLQHSFAWTEGSHSVRDAKSCRIIRVVCNRSRLMVATDKCGTEASNRCDINVLPRSVPFVLVYSGIERYHWVLRERVYGGRSRLV